jgi:Cu+-exporting ATPase
VLALAVAAYALSGLTQVGPEEVAVVRRFGRQLPDDLGPGLHWRWPRPIEDVTRVKPGRVQTVEVGFRTESPAALPAARAWSSPHGNDGVRRLPDEAVMITGDGNLVELQATVRYTVADPRAYLFETADPAAVLRSAAESVLREMIAGRTFADLLTTDRARFHEEALARLRERCRAQGPGGMGLKLEGLALHDLHPPQEVVEAYHDVTKAMEVRDQLVNQAQAAALSRERGEQARSLETTRQADAARDRDVRMARARQAEFLARSQARTHLDAATEARLLGGLWNALAEGQKPEDAGRDYRRRREEAAAVQAMLTDFRLYWDRLSGALSGREKVVVDADKVPGRRHLWLVPFEALRTAVPAMTPPGRGSRTSPQGAYEKEP